MDLPEHFVLPAPVWLITTLHVVTLTVHLLAMNALLGGVLLLLLRGARHPSLQRYVRLLPSLMAATVTFGVAPLLFVQLLYPRLIYAAAIVNGWYWLLIVLAAIVAYYCLYAAASRSRRVGGAGGWLWVAVLGMLYISFVYSAVFSLAETPGRMQSLYQADPTGATLDLALGSFGFRWLHMVLGALAVGSFVVGLVVRDDAAAAGSVRWLFLYGMVFAMGAGLAYLLTLGDLLQPFMRSPGIWFLTAGIVLAVGALHLAFTRRLALAGVALGLSMLGMVAARHALRLVALEGVTGFGASRVSPQWVVFGIFLVCFLLAIGVIAWMLRVFVAGQPDAAEAGAGGGRS